jgi:hypothetical protein
MATEGNRAKRLILQTFQTEIDFLMNNSGFTLTNEIMVNFGKNFKLNTFHQNRAFIGLGYRVPKIGRLEVGCQNQYLMKSDGKTVEPNGFTNILLFANFDLYNKK